MKPRYAENMNSVKLTANRVHFLVSVYSQNSETQNKQHMNDNERLCHTHEGVLPDGSTK